MRKLYVIASFHVNARKMYMRGFPYYSGNIKREKGVI